MKSPAERSNSIKHYAIGRKEYLLYFASDAIYVILEKADKGGQAMRQVLLASVHRPHTCQTSTSIPSSNPVAERDLHLPVHMNLPILNILSHINEKHLDLFHGHSQRGREQPHAKPFKAIQHVDQIPLPNELEFGILSP